MCAKIDGPLAARQTGHRTTTTPMTQIDTDIGIGGLITRHN
jgi:hypothetical protein